MSKDQERGARGVLDKVAGKAKEAIGDLAGNDELAEEGQLQQARAETAAEAQRLATEAEHAQEEAELAAAQVTNRIERERLDAELTAEAQEERAERERHGAQAAVERAAAREEALVEHQADAGEAVLDLAEHEVAVDQVETAATAARIEQDAARAEASADALDAAQANIDQRATGG